jgi:hypothetical protein
MPLFRRSFINLSTPANNNRQRRKKGGLLSKLSSSRQPLLALEDSSGVSPRYSMERWNQFDQREEPIVPRSPSVLQPSNKNNKGNLKQSKGTTKKDFIRGKKQKKNTKQKGDNDFVVNGHLDILEQSENDENAPQSWMTFETNALLFTKRKTEEERTGDEEPEYAEDDQDIQLVQKVLSEDQKIPERKEQQEQAPIVAIQDILKPQRSAELGDDEDEAPPPKDDDEISFSDHPQERKAIECLMEKNLLAGPTKKDTEPIFDLKDKPNKKHKKKEKKERQPDELELELTYSVSDSESDIVGEEDQSAHRGVEGDEENNFSNVSLEAVEEEHKFPQNDDNNMKTNSIFNNTTEIMSEAHTPCIISTKYTSPSNVNAKKNAPRKIAVAVNQNWEDFSIPPPMMTPLGSTAEEIHMINRFLKVVGPDFHGISLSMEERIDIYNKASRAMLSKEFVDKMLDQSAGVIASTRKSDTFHYTPRSDGGNFSTSTKETESVNYYTLPRTSPLKQSKFTGIGNYTCNDTFKQYFWNESRKAGRDILESMQAVASHDSQSVHSECMEA